MFEQLLPDGIPHINTVFPVIIILIAAAIFYGLVMRAIKLAASKGKFSPPVAAFLRMVLRWSVIFLTILLILHNFSILRNAWAAMLAVLTMIAIGFVAVWSVLSNAMCLLLILIYRPFRVGDRIRIPADELGGTVIDLNLMFTTLRDEDGDLIQIPNNTFFQKAIKRTPGKGNISLHEQLSSRDPAE